MAHDAQTKISEQVTQNTEYFVNPITENHSHLAHKSIIKQTTENKSSHYSVISNIKALSNKNDLK